MLNFRFNQPLNSPFTIHHSPFKAMDYKATLNLPKTDFPMKANLPQREPELLA